MAISDFGVQIVAGDCVRKHETMMVKYHSKGSRLSQRRRCSMIEKYLQGCDCSAPAVSGVHQRSRSDNTRQGCAAVRLIPLPPCMRLTFIESHSQAEIR